ncbi:MAG: LacI family DNA-binding transcriptional regulator, partial [Caldilineaceae bacterium]
PLDLPSVRRPQPEHPMANALSTAAATQLTAADQPARVTITDLAHEAGVSPATVSLVLRNKPGVGEATRRRVLDLAQARGYAPPRRDSRPGFASRARQVAVIIKSRPDDRPERNEFYSHVLVGIEAVCREQRVHLFWGSVLVDERNHPLEVPPLLDDAVADGLLVVGTWVDAGLLATLRRAAVPMVLVDSYTALPEGEDTTAPLDAVVTDNRKGGAEAAAHLLALGHTAIALLGTGPGAFPSLRQRGEGFADAVATHNGTVELPPVRLFETGPLRDEEEAETALRLLLATHPEISACFAANDALAIGALLAARRARRRVPADFSLVGFDDIVRAEHLIPPLTTLRVDKVKVGRMAAHLLLDRIARPTGAAVVAAVEPELIVRASTAPAPAPASLQSPLPATSALPKARNR